LFDTNEKSAASVAQDLQIDTLSETSFLGAVRRLRWLLNESRRDGEAPGVCWPIEEFGNVSRNAWLTAQYRLLARIVDEDPQSLWSQRTALVGGLALRAVRDDNQIAVPVVAEQDGDPRFPGGLRLAFFSQSPRYWEREEHADKWIFTTRSQLQTKLYRWAEALGAERIPPSRPPAYTGTPIDAPQAVRELRREVRDRLPLLLGVFKAHKAEKLDEMARIVLDAMDGLRAVEPDRADGAGSSGLDAEGNLVFSYPAYQETDQASQTVVLAEGIALLVNQTTAVGDLQNALGAPPRQVELALHFRGVDLDDIVKSVSSLARERVQSLRKRIERLVRALSEAAGLSSPPSINWETDESLGKDWMGIVESLQALQGATADEALDAIHRAAPDLVPSACQKLLRQVIDTGLSPSAAGRHLLAVLREAGWSLEKRKIFAESDYLKDGLFDLHHQQEAIDATVCVAVTVALMEQLRTGELDGDEDVPHRLSNLGRDLQSRVSWQAIDRATDFVRHLEEELKISVPFEPPDLLLIEWEEKTWNQLKETLRETGHKLLPEVPEGFREVIGSCLAQGSLLPLQEGQRQKLDERQRRIRDLERHLDQRKVFFNPEELIDPSSVEGSPSAETSTPGTGGGPGPAVTSDQAVRGRVAELFVLRGCWMRFLECDEDMRRQILEDIKTRRREGSGEGADYVSWSTKTAWRDLEKRLGRHQEDLIACQQEPDGVSGNLEKLFKALIEVANERGPGYDVLDPFGMWGRTQGDSPRDAAPRRVEIKAILQDTEGNTVYRIVLTTNEYHRACRDPESYVLRLISVPREPEEHLNQVQWVCDIPNPVQALKLNKQIGKGVRGGTLPLALELRGNAGDQA
jgi:DNA-binding transcriptional ArsR family regulator